MASLAVAAVGASLGGAFIPTIFGVSGTAIGWAIGSFLGSTLFGPGGQDVQGPRLSDLKVQSSAYGAPLPIIYGKARVSGNVIWAKDIRERKIEEDVGGKGGGGGTSTTYEYYGSFAVGLCDNEIAGVRKIWADSVLIYDVGDTSSLETIRASNRNADKIAIYFGTETQVADSLIQSDKGAANTQAYRGTAYIVFDDLLLEKYGNRIPNITCEVVTSGSLTARRLNDWNTVTYDGLLVRATHWDADGTAHIFQQEFDAFNGFGLSAIKYFKHYANNLVEEAFAGSLGFSTTSAPFYGTGDQPWYGVYNRSIGARNRIYMYSVSDGGINSSARFLNPLNDGTSGNFLQSTQAECILYNDAFYWVTSGDGTSDSYILKGDVGLGATALTVSQFYPLQIINDSISGDMKVGAYSIDYEDGVLYVLYNDNTIQTFDEQGVFIEEISFSPSPAIAYSYVNREPSIRVDRGVIWIIEAENVHKIENGVYSFGGNTQLQFGIGAEQTVGGRDVQDGVLYYYMPQTIGSDTNGTYWPFALESLSSSSITLSSIVSDIDERAGLDALDDDTTALNDTVEGYVVTRPMAARKAIEPLQQAFFFDAAEIDNVLTYVKRGGTVTATIPEVDLGAGDYGQDVDLYVQTRQQDSELPAEMVVDYIDLNRSYEEGAQRAQRINSPQENVVKMQLPIVMTASYAKEIAHVLLYNAHVEREKFSLSLTNEYINLNPTDVINFTVGSDTRKARITKITYGDTLLLDLLAEDSTIYSADVVAGDSEENEQVVGLDGPTKLYLMDIPLLRNQDNDAGLYIAGGGYFSGWTGASIFKSLDGGISYTPVNDVLAASVMGKATTVLASANHTTFDYTSTVTVSLASGTLSSSTESAVIQGANYALLGTEIIQFVNATDNGDGTYTLSTLLRGRRGTDWAVGTHAVGDLFCLLRENVLERVGAIVNTERYYKAVTFGTFLDEALAQTKTNTGVSQKPFSVKYIAGTRDGSNNLSITWTRRSRYIGTPLWTPPVFEDSQSYRIEILTGVGGSVINTYTASTPAYTYTAAQQTADGLTPGNTVYVNIYQVGAVNGYETEATL